MIEPKVIVGTCEICNHDLQPNDWRAVDPYTHHLGCRYCSTFNLKTRMFYGFDPAYEEDYAVKIKMDSEGNIHEIVYIEGGQLGDPKAL